MEIGAVGNRVCNHNFVVGGESMSKNTKRLQIRRIHVAAHGG